MANIEGLNDEFKPTEEQRRIVERMRAFRVQDSVIILAIENSLGRPISKATFYKVFDKQLKHAKGEMHQRVFNKWAIALESDDPKIWMPAAEKIERLMGKGVYEKKFEMPEGLSPREELKRIKEALNQGLINTYEAECFINAVKTEIESEKEVERNTGITINVDGETMASLSEVVKDLAK